MLVRSLHLSYLPEYGQYRALLDFVGPDWDGAPQCSFGEVRSGAVRVTEQDPHTVCLLAFDAPRPGASISDRTKKRVGSLRLKRIDVNTLLELVRTGRDIVCCDARANPPADDLLSKSRRVLSSVWRAQARPDAVVDERNRISKACLLLMAAHDCSEETAFAALRRRAMSCRMPLAELANRVLRSEEAGRAGT